MWSDRFKPWYEEALFSWQIILKLCMDFYLVLYNVMKREQKYYALQNGQAIEDS